ncbi:unnamed protein product, partial [Brenthis ino]
MASKEQEALEKSSGSTVELKRELGLFSAINLILGVMIGSGIFVSPSSALEHSGSVALCLIIWTVSGIISLLGALSFAELGTVLGKSGAEYSYFQEAFGKCHKYWGPLPSFICAWIYVMILRPAEVAIIVMTFAEYAMQPFTTDINPDHKRTAIKLGSLAALYGLSEEIKRLKLRCLDACNIIENSPLDANITPNNIGDKALCYVEGLRTEIQNSITIIPTDENLIISQFLAEIKDKTEQVEELAAFTRGSICDVDKEIQRLNNLTKTAQEALSRPRIVQKEIHPEHLQKAKETFHVLKNELHGLIQSLFPNSSDHIMDVMGQLMQEKLNEESNGYIQITREDYQIVKLLQDMNIIIANPYNNMEVKIAH